MRVLPCATRGRVYKEVKFFARDTRFTKAYGNIVCPIYEQTLRGRPPPLTIQNVCVHILAEFQNSRTKYIQQQFARVNLDNDKHTHISQGELLLHLASLRSLLCFYCRHVSVYSVESLPSAFYQMRSRCKTNVRIIQSFVDVFRG